MHFACSAEGRTSAHGACNSRLRVLGQCRVKMYYIKFSAESVSEGGERAWASARAGWPEARRAARAVEVRLISYTPRSSICRSVQMRITISSAFPACPPAQCPCTFLWVHLECILCGTHLSDRLRFADAGLGLKYIDVCDLKFGCRS